MSNLKVNSACIMCGSCLSFGYDFLEEESDGHITVKENTFLSAESKELKSLMEICPVKALEYDKNVPVKSKAEQVEQIKKKLKGWQGLKKPEPQDLPFDEKKYFMNMPFLGGSSYTYSSDRAAMNAAEKKFDNGAYSKINVFILQIVSQYRADKVSPYYTYGPDTNSIYYKENQKIIEMLKQIEKLSDKKLGEDFSSFEIYPYRDICYKMLQKGELVGDNLVSSVYDEFRSGSYSSLSSYRMYFDTDSMERYAGTGLFGKEKYVDKYCYGNLSEATRELEKDLRNALRYTTDRIQRHASEIARGLTETYNNQAKEELAKKLAML